MAEHVAFSPCQINMGEHTYDDCMRVLDDTPIELLQLSFRSSANIIRLNIGSLLYLKRTKPKAFTPAYVHTDTYHENRVEPLFNWATKLVVQFYRELRPISVYEDYGRTAIFLEWCDNNDHTLALDSIEEYHLALVQYSRYLCAKIKPGGKRNTAQRKLTVAIQAAGKFFPEHNYNLNIGIEYPGYSKEEKNNTIVPSEDILFPTLASARGLFESICEFLSGSRQIPTSFERYGQTYWFTSCYYPVMSEKAILHYQTSRTPGRILRAIRRDVLDCTGATGNDISGRFRTVIDRLIERGGIADAAATDHYIPLHTEISKADLLRLCKVAHDSFLFMFVLYTEGNEASAASIPWDNTSSVESVIQSFRTIKWRSHTEIDLSFEVKFLVLFRAYLRVREILVEGNDFGYLFGTFSLNNSPLPLGIGYSAIIGAQLKRLVDPNLATFGFRELRAYHHHYKTKHHGIEAAAANAQHTIDTALSSYQAGMPADNIHQAGAFFSSFGLVLTDLEQAQTRSNTQAGACNGQLIPARELSEASIQPDCRNFLGCLFCDSHLIHFNAEDAHKLLSMAYIIEQLRLLQISPGEHEQVFEITLRKIYWIIEKMEPNAILAAEIQRIRVEVFEQENLTPYWQNKLRLLTDIGVL